MRLVKINPTLWINVDMITEITVGEGKGARIYFAGDKDNCRYVDDMSMNEIIDLITKELESSWARKPNP